MQHLRNALTAFLSIGELAQLGERLVCNQEVTGSSPVFSTLFEGAALSRAGLAGTIKTPARLWASDLVERINGVLGTLVPRTHSEIPRARAPGVIFDN